MFKTSCLKHRHPCIQYFVSYCEHENWHVMLVLFGEPHGGDPDSYSRVSTKDFLISRVQRVHTGGSEVELVLAERELERVDRTRVELTPAHTERSTRMRAHRRYRSQCAPTQVGAH